MDQTNDGGPAFPGETWGSKGISKRDYFAGQALAGLLACDETGGRKERFAKVAYEYADAMLAERRKERE